MDNIPEYEIFAMLFLYPLMFVAGLGALILIGSALARQAYWHLFGSALALGYFGFTWWSLQGDNMTFDRLMLLIVVGIPGFWLGMVIFGQDS